MQNLTIMEERANQIHLLKRKITIDWNPLNRKRNLLSI